MNPLVSCVMLTTYPQRAEMRAQAIRSFLLQTVAESELVVVNDGAPMAVEHPRIAVVNLPAPMSIGSKRNIGTACSRGEWIATWDDDDFSFPERLELELREATEQRAPYVRCSAVWLADASLAIQGKIRHAGYATSLVHRPVLNHVGGYPDTSWLEDMELYMRLVIRGIKRATIPDVVYVYRRHGGQASAGDSADTKLLQCDPTGAAEANERMRALLGQP